MTLKPEDLKPCPFCASPGRTTYMGLAANRWAVGCSSPGCFVLTCDFESEPDAIAAWNRRPDPRPSPVGREEVREKVAQKIGSYVVHDDKGGPDTKVLHDVIGGDYDEATRRVYELTDAILALFSPADGWRLVPETPTEEMLDEADQPFHDEWRAQREQNAKAGRDPNACFGSGPFSDAIYRAMLAAAPPPPGGQG